MTRKQVLTARILRLANIWLSRPVSKENAAFHLRVSRLQCAAIREKKALANPASSFFIGQRVVADVIVGGQFQNYVTGTVVKITPGGFIAVETDLGQTRRFSEGKVRPYIR